MAVTATCMEPIIPQPFHLYKSEGKQAYKGPVSIKTVNVGMLPTGAVVLKAAEKFGSIFTGNTNIQMLSLPTVRAKKIAETLTADNEVPILCLQEVFDVPAAECLAQKLSASGYSVLYSRKGQGTLANSGILFATRYSIEQSGVQFWKFTNLTGDDALSSKGVLKVPLRVVVPDGRVLKLVVYTTHLQSGEEAGSIRSEQLNRCYYTINNDYWQDQEQVMLLAGDLNVSDMECGGEWQGERMENDFFFSKFHDFVDSTFHHIEGSRNPDVAGTYPNEPNGTFYKDLTTGEVEQGVYYDRILLFKGNEKLAFDYSLSILRSNDEGLSDHCPVQLTLGGL